MPLTSVQDADPRTIHVYQGTVWRGTFVWTQEVDPPTDPPTYEPVDMTGYTARFRWFAKAGGLVLLTVTSPDTDDGGVAIDLAAGELVPHLCAEQTALLTKDGAFEIDVISVTEPCEVVRVSAGFANLILAGEPWPYPAV